MVKHWNIYRTFRLHTSQKGEGLRSETIVDRLIVPRTEKKTFADRAFSVVGPKVWNNLPNDVRSQKDVGHFKKSLTTHLFKLAFNT